MFQVPAYITMTIAATRLYRSLADFSSSTDMYDILYSLPFWAHCGRYRFSAHEALQDGRPVVHGSRRMVATLVPMDRVEVSVHIVSEQYVTPYIRDDDSGISTGDEIHEKSNGMSYDKDAERGV